MSMHVHKMILMQNSSFQTLKHKFYSDKILQFHSLRKPYSDSFENTLVQFLFMATNANCRPPSFNTSFLRSADDTIITSPTTKQKQRHKCPKSERSPERRTTRKLSEKVCFRFYIRLF